MNHLTSESILDIIDHLASFTRVTAVRDGWIMRCPFHEDSRPSMKVWKKNGGWHCMGCGEGGNLARLSEMLGGEWEKIPSTRSSSQRRWASGTPTGSVSAEYIYRNELGQPLYKVVRFIPKSFRQMKWTGSKWEWRLKENGRRVLYNLDLIATNPEFPIVLVEGEKDADFLVSHGLLASTTPMGANKWRGEYGEMLRGREVILIPDNDESGLLHMTSILTYLNKNKIAQARMIKIPEQYKDVSEWGDIDKIKELINQT